MIFAIAFRTVRSSSRASVGIKFPAVNVFKLGINRALVQPGTPGWKTLKRHHDIGRIFSGLITHRQWSVTTAE